MATRHYLLDPDGRVDEFSEQEAARVASGLRPLPQYADKALRYLQVAYDDNQPAQGELRVYTTGALIRFDGDGRMTEADALDNDTHRVSAFEHEACVQFALRHQVPGQYVLN
ncbi:MAG: hypothetical protein RJQ08_16795 [Salinisphaeraceae bacterium]